MDKDSAQSVNKLRRIHSFIKQKKTKSYDDGSQNKHMNSHECYLPADERNTCEDEIKFNSFKKCMFNFRTVYMSDIRAENLYRSLAALRAEKYRHYKFYSASIHPFSKLRIWFEALFVIVTIASSTVMAIHLSETYPHEDDYHYKMIYVFDFVYLINIVLNFFTGYIEGDTCRYIVLNLKKIAWKYVRTWLIIDLMSTFCSVPGLITLNHIYPRLILISLKLLRLPVMMLYLDNVLTVLRVGILKKTLAEIFFLMYSYLSWTIFFEFSIDYLMEESFNPLKPSNCSWLSIANVWDKDMTTRLIFAFDRSVALLRKNSNINLIQERACFERFFIVAWLVSKILVSHCALKYIVSQFGTQSAKAKFFIMTKQVETLMNQRKFPPRIKEKILKFYTIRFQSSYFEESLMLNCVTGQLREDILMHTGRQLVNQMEFLKQLPRSLLLHIGLKLKIVIFIAGDIIFKINTVGDCLYFIDKGTVAIYSESGNEICHLEDGDYFGEIASVMKHGIRTASAVAVSNCELFRLDKEDFDSSIACYPTVYEEIKKVAINRYERTCLLDEHHKTELKMAADHNRKVLSDLNLEDDNY